MSEATVGVKTNPVNSSHVWGILGIFLRNPGDSFFYELWKLKLAFYNTNTNPLQRRLQQHIIYNRRREVCWATSGNKSATFNPQQYFIFKDALSKLLLLFFLSWSKHTSNLVNCMGWLCHVISIWWHPSALEKFFFFFKNIDNFFICKTF